MSRSRHRLFFALTVAFPLLLLVALEGSLRLFGYGVNLDLFVRETIAGTEYLRMNPEVKSRYFSTVPFNPSTSPDLFRMPKPAGTYRIFCLGGSTTVGYPYWYNGAFSTFLRERLETIFPGRKIEVINMGMTATNSFTVNDMARELVDYQPDLFIVYGGHNEFYGALGAASHESLGQFRWLTVLYLRLIHLRTFLLVRNAVAGITSLFAHPPQEHRGSNMMEKLARGQYIPYHSPLYERTLAFFRENLGELREIAARRGVPVIVSSQVSNLRDLPPFVSGSPAGPQPPRAYEALYRQGLELLQRPGRADSALHCLREAERIDSLRAEVHYRIALCLDSLGRKGEARREYVRARDLDMLRFRASSEFNDAIRSVCNDSSMIFADIERTFRDASPDSLIGNNLIVEHLHPNSRGFFLMGKAYARIMREHQFLAPEAAWARNDTVPDQVYWDRRPLTDLDERIARRRTEILTSGWPFHDQAPIVDPVAAGDTLGQIAELVTRAEADWQQAHRDAVEYYASRNDQDGMEREYRTLISQIPYEMIYYRKLGKMLLDRGELEELRKLMLKSLEYEKTILAYRALGDIALRSGRSGEAASWYEGMFQFPQSPPEQVENGYLLSLSYARSGRQDQAKAGLMKVLKIRPDYQPAIELLTRLSEKK